MQSKGPKTQELKRFCKSLITLPPERLSSPESACPLATFLHFFELIFALTHHLPSYLRRQRIRPNLLDLPLLQFQYPVTTTGKG
jgi:hypothetical protein